MPQRRVFPTASPLRLKRMAAGVTLARAAAAAGVSHSQASLLERGLTIDAKDAALLERAIEKLAAPPSPEPLRLGQLTKKIRVAQRRGRRETASAIGAQGRP